MSKGDKASQCPGHILPPLSTRFIHIQELFYGKSTFPEHWELQFSTCKSYFYPLMSFLGILVGVFIACKGQGTGPNPLKPEERLSMGTGIVLEVPEEARHGTGRTSPTTKPSHLCASCIKKKLAVSQTAT